MSPTSELDHLTRIRLQPLAQSAVIPQNGPVPHRAERLQESQIHDQCLELNTSAPLSPMRIMHLIPHTCTSPPLPEAPHPHKNECTMLMGSATPLQYCNINLLASLFSRFLRQNRRHLQSQWRTERSVHTSLSLTVSSSKAIRAN